MKLGAAIFLLLQCALLCRAQSTPSPDNFATVVLDWNGTKGVSGYNAHPELALGAPSALARPDVPDNTSLFSFGWGGYLTLGFNRPIRNDPRHPGGYDFIVFGNALYAGGDNTAPFREPGYVEVGVDTNGQHLYGDGSAVVWYWLKGTPAPANIGGFPIPAPGWTDTMTGYADCTPTDGSGDPLIPTNPSGTGILEGSAGGDAFDLDWAVDANGVPKHLEYADFVRVTCAVDALTNLGVPYSTEVDAVSLVRPRVPGDVDFDDSVTILDACIVTRAVSGLTTLSAEQVLRADVNGHGGPPTIADAAGILRLAAGIA